MKGFIIHLPDFQTIRFKLYEDEAPVTTAAFLKLLPFNRVFFHARFSGEEIWINNAPELDIIQENASIFTLPGEVVYGPSKPSRAKTKNSMGIYYGNGKGLDCCNIFGKVFNEDFHILQDLGNKIWRQGEQQLLFEKLQ